MPLPKRGATELVTILAFILVIVGCGGTPREM